MPSLITAQDAGSILDALKDPLLLVCRQISSLDLRVEAALRRGRDRALEALH
jgi:hypothetical protein